MRTTIVNIGTIVSGDWRKPLTAGDSVSMIDGRIDSVGAVSDRLVRDADVVIDAGGATVCPGLIDSQVHITFGDYTPRQKTVGYLESYLHGGTTTSISASEVHVPGRPSDPEGVKALAVAAHKSFLTYRPAGMTVHAGSIIIEPGLTDSDFHEVAAKGVWLAKAGFGRFDDPYDYAPYVAAARQAGLITTVHTGGASIPDSSAISGDHVLKMNPHVSFHVNGGPVAIADEDFPRLIAESDIAMQVCTAGNLRTALMCAKLCIQEDAFDRYIIATDTPTGSGIMPLGMIYTMSHLASLADLDPAWCIAAATGNNAKIYGLESGFVANGKLADLLIIDAPLGCTKHSALSALANGDPVAIGAVITEGVPRFVGRSRNTPPTTRRVYVSENRMPQSYDTPRH